jgi:hypothetical protein
MESLSATINEDYDLLNYFARNEERRTENGGLSISILADVKFFGHKLNAFS